MEDVLPNGENCFKNTEIILECQSEKNYSTETTIDYFKKHLTYPKPLQKSTKIKSGPSTRAISAKAWRSYYIEKEKEKEEKEILKKRKREENERKRVEKSFKSKKSKLKFAEPEIISPEEVVRKKEKCGVCEEELDSDAEEEGEKNIGCDVCPRWFHLVCTKLSRQSYKSVINQEFFCDFCSDD